MQAARVCRLALPVSFIRGVTVMSSTIIRFMGHHHDDDLIRSNIGTNLGTDSGEDQEAACAPVDCNTDRGCCLNIKGRS